MGIPAYYKKLIQNYPEIIIHSSNYNNKINNIFFDLNCAIHPCCAGKINEKEMFSAILQKIKDCITITNVKDKIFIAIDGPAPRTKMEQQRQRRLKSSQENKIWDTNQITPGTNFMNQLNNFLKKEIKNLNIKTILSDSNDPGEGEHKIMKYIDDNIDINTNNIIYGLDADLIMLSMIRKHNILLLRERTSFNIENTDEEYIYLDINCLKNNLIDSIYEPFYNINRTSLLNDYLFICFLIGNDFIINSPSINIRYNGLEILLSIYKNIQKDYFGRFFLIENKKINFNNFKIFIKELSTQEDNNIKKIINIRNKKNNFLRKKYSKLLSSNKIKNINDIDLISAQDINMNEEEYDSMKYISPLLFRENEEKIITNKMIYYTFTLYNNIDYNPSFNQILKKDINILCKEYIKSIEWTFSYYFDKCLSWKWYYKFHSAPLFKDLDKYLSLITEFSNDFKNDDPYSPKEQLNIVLPQQKNTYLYPKRTPLFSFMKTYYWECHPILPH